MVDLCPSKIINFTAHILCSYLTASYTHKSAEATYLKEPAGTGQVQILPKFRGTEQYLTKVDERWPTRSGLAVADEGSLAAAYQA